MLDAIFYFALGMIAVMLIRRFVFSVYVPSFFLKKISPTLESAAAYSMSLSDGIAGAIPDKEQLKIKRNHFEKSLLTQYGVYPEKVFNRGFNPGLRAGFRLFLINIDRVAELLFAIESVCCVKKDEQLITSLSFLASKINESMRENEKIMLAMVAYAQTQALPKTSSDFVSDINNLETALKEVVPGNLELIDLSVNYEVLLDLVRSIRDLRHVLLKMLTSVVAESSEQT